MGEKRCTEIGVGGGFTDTCVSVSGVNIRRTFGVDTLGSVSIEWENDTCCSVSGVNIRCTFVVDTLGSVSLEWKKESCSIELTSETCNCEGLVEDSQDED